MSNSIDLVPGVSSETFLKTGEAIGWTLGVLIAAVLTYSLLHIIKRGELKSFVHQLVKSILEFAAALVGVQRTITSQSSEEDLQRFVDRLVKTRLQSQIVSVEAEHKIVQLFEDAVSAGLGDEVRLAIASLVEREVANQAESRSDSAFRFLQERLEIAARTASIRGFFNLAIGIAFAIVALLILKSAVELFTPGELATLSLSQATYFMGVRVSLALIITLISYFFLSLYRNSLSDVKYYQDETRRVGLSEVAVALSQQCNNDNSRAALAELLIAGQRDTARADATPLPTNDLTVRLMEKIIDKIPALKTPE